MNVAPEYAGMVRMAKPTAEQYRHLAELAYRKRGFSTVAAFCLHMASRDDIPFRSAWKDAASL